MVLGSEIVRLESWVLWLRVRRLLLCAVSREDAAPERVGRERHGERQEGSAEPAWLQEGGVELAASGGVCLRVVVFEALWQCSAGISKARPLALPLLALFQPLRDACAAETGLK